jgi:hypothetical protein
MGLFENQKVDASANPIHGILPDEMPHFAIFVGHGAF